MIIRSIGTALAMMVGLGSFQPPVSTGYRNYRGPTPSRRKARRHEFDVGSDYPGAKMARKAANGKLTVRWG